MNQSNLREILHYDPDTGFFTWLVDRGTNKTAGKRAGCFDKRSGYRRITIEGYLFLEHRLAWLYMIGAWPENEIDHRNLNREDNRWENLREATSNENNANLKIKSHNQVGYKGVWRDNKTGRYRAKIEKEGTKHYLGYHDTPEQAHEAYCEKALELFGEYANFG